MEKQIEKFAKYKQRYWKAKERNINEHCFMCHYFSFVLGASTLYMNFEIVYFE
jgi:hypothetical protein